MKRALVVVVVCVVTASLAAGCGGSSCEDAVGNAAKIFGYGGASYGAMRAEAIKQCKDDHYSEAMRSCLASAKNKDDLLGCDKHRNRSATEAAKEYIAKSKKSEADLNLDLIQKRLKVYFIEFAEFPAGSAPLTPSTPCCEGNGFKCMPDASAWASSEVWQKLDFAVHDPGYFQYSYSSADGKTVEVEAVGDLDCDGTTITYRLLAESRNGSPEFVVLKPTNAD